MPLDPAATWGADVKSAIDSVGVTAGSEVTPAQLIQVWTAIVGEHRDQLTTKAQTSTTGATGSGPAGGPLPIVSQLGVIT